MTDSVETVWRRLRERLRTSLPAETFGRWITVIHPVSLSERRLILGVANDFYVLWLTENYLPLIRKLAAEEGLDLQDICFRVSDQAPQPAANADPDPVPAETPRRGNARSKAATPPALCDSFTFDTFVVGPSNSFAHAACTAVAQKPACAYNPLLIYGGPGLGKTHLIQAIGHHVYRTASSRRVCYLSAESFLNEYIEALHTHQATDFRKRYRSVDVLLLDDVHFLAGKDGIQEEFFNTFNALFYNRKQIVLTCDRPIAEIHGLEPRLVSRFGWGLIAELTPPDFETRVAILKKKADLIHADVPIEVMHFIAEHISRDMRKLEGALIRVVSYASLMQQPATVDMASRLLRDSLEATARTISFDVIQRRVAETFDLRLSDLCGKSRTQSVALPRQVAMYLCRRLTRQSLPAIAQAFARNHATVIHACRTVENRIQTDPGFRQLMDQLLKKISDEA